MQYDDLIAHPEAGPFWKGVSEGVLLLPWCESCHRPHWYPRAFCPLCGGTTISWSPDSGDGKIYTFTVLRKAGNRIPAWVTLDCGVSLFTNIETADPDRLRIGQPVRLAFRDTPEGLRLPVFSVREEGG